MRRSEFRNHLSLQSSRKGEENVQRTVEKPSEKELSGTEKRRQEPGAGAGNGGQRQRAAAAGQPPAAEAGPHLSRSSSFLKSSHSSSNAGRSLVREQTNPFPFTKSRDTQFLQYFSISSVVAIFLLCLY